MKAISTILLLMIAIYGQAQEVRELKKYKDAQGWGIGKGDTLYLLAGTMPGGNYYTITAGKRYDEKNDHLQPGPEYLVIAGLKRLIYPNGMFTIEAVTEVNGTAYTVDMFSSFDKGEVKAPAGYSQNKKIKQGIDSANIRNGQLFYEFIDTVAGKKDAIYNAAKITIVNLFNSANAVLQLQDKEEGHIMGKGILQMRPGAGFTAEDRQLKVTFDIKIKDGRYRLQIYDIIFENRGYQQIAFTPHSFSELQETAVKSFNKKWAKATLADINVACMAFEVEFAVGILKELKKGDDF